MFLLIKLIRESYLFAFQAIIANKLRTVLSLSGITIGIFSVISVLSVFDSLEKSIRDSLSELGSNVIFIQKWPWGGMNGEYPWWKYLNRPEATLAEMEELQRRSISAEAVAFFFGTNRTVKYHSSSYDNVNIVAISYDYDRVLPLNIREGRYFTRSETLAGRNVGIIGSEIAKSLFPNSSPIGQRIKVFGSKVVVIGVLMQQGDGTFGNSTDEQIYLPVNFVRNFINVRNTGTTIVVKGRPEISVSQVKDELIGIMRSLRKLKPGEENDFAVNEVSVINQNLQSFFSGLAVIGWIIGAFSLLVGAFGIANIMFVSVRERTNIIGIQKAIGAKKYFILLQFLFEAVFLSLLGGIVGLILIFLGTLIFSGALPFPLILSQQNILLGMGISTFFGLVSGIIPAWVASRLDPVEAIRFGI